MPFLTPDDTQHHGTGPVSMSVRDMDKGLQAMRDAATLGSPQTALSRKSLLGGRWGAT